MAHCYFTLLLVACLLTTISVASASSKRTKKKQVVEGFPVGFQCLAAVGSRPKTKLGDTVQCVIQTTDQELFNKSFLWKDIEDKGYFVNDTDGLDNMIFNITLKWSNKTRTVSYETQVVKTFKIDYHDQYIPRGINYRPFFRIPEKLNGISQEQLDAIELFCYRDNVTVDERNLEYQPKERTRLIKILKASCETSAGYYECYFQYNGIKLKVRSFEMCVRAPISTKDPLIFDIEEDYDVEPGGTVVMTCSGNVGWVGRNDAQIFWKKIQPDGTLTKLCYTSSGEKDKNCTMNVSVPKCCECESAKKFLTALKTDGDFVSTFTKTNVTINDNGNYRCKLGGVRAVERTFTITVRSRVAKNLALHLGVALVFTTVILLLILVLIICRRQRTEIKYFKKKRFGKFQETGNPITYLLYSDDALGRCRGRNPLSDVIRWLKAQDQHYYDPNDENSYSSVGGGDRMEISHLRAILDRCLSMTVFVTPNLLNENTWEVFRQYMGFEDNVKRNFPIVFICEKELEEFVKKEAKNERKGRRPEINGAMRNFVTLEHFMKRNTVIHWKSKNCEKFDRALYAALPKVRRVNDEEKEQCVTI